MKLLNFVAGDVVETQTAGLECVKDANGVLWYKNVDFDFVMNSKMEVYQIDTDIFHKVKASQISTNGWAYSIKVDSKFSSLSTSGIVAKLFNLDKKKTETLMIIDEQKGLIEGNFKFQHPSTYEYRAYLNKLKLIKKSELSKSKILTPVIEKENVIILKLDDFKSLVPEIQKIEGFKEYQTDDGSIFTSKEIADWHQKNVDKGKNNAEIVVSYGGGYALAEQIYMQEVKYPEGKKPYKDFKVMLSQVGGIQVLDKPAKFTIELDKSNVKSFNDEREANLFAKKVGAFRFLESTVK